MNKKCYIFIAALALGLLCSSCGKASPLCEPAKAVAPAPLEKIEKLDPPAPTPAASPEETKSAVSGDNFLTDIENQVMDLINAERRSLGLQELEYDPALQNAARIRSKELCQSEEMQTKKLSHIRPDGSPWHTVLTKDIPIPNMKAAGEILARERTTNGNGADQDPIPAKDWFLLWKSSKSHYDNITWPEAQKIGVGVYYEVRDGEYYTNATVLFGIYTSPPAQSTGQ